eukprot:CAMPEP_0183326954 /NCGR_PEP_ID=MMETSP0160_2-20130417/83508_1 /TAXON_ID=2839 ORGANISM="Odontella Sinensis, Strain Grunow 1884" /NCGR_SAMPLE_ID=MMETSP0160_2 /ASSEMBLY_ACC=CAM_ASM_000250 /LENGTH=134 /DNA_ID=CAMNT_0025495057 /DNA_START=137 /DNA_END=541 /DNA_ORIENTATION=+
MKVCCRDNSAVLPEEAFSNKKKMTDEDTVNTDNDSASSSIPSLDVSPRIFCVATRKRNSRIFWTEEQESLLSLKRANPIYDSDSESGSENSLKGQAKRTRRCLDADEESGAVAYFLPENQWPKSRSNYDPEDEG